MLIGWREKKEKKKELKILLSDGVVDLEVTDLIFYDFYKQCKFIGKFNLSGEIGLERDVERSQDMTMVFKMSQNNIFTMKTVKENNVRRNKTESFEFLSFFKEPREKKASLYPHQAFASFRTHGGLSN